jgi:L-rhamnose isomerase
MGFRSWQKALLAALCTPHEALKKLQDENRMTELMVEQEAVKTLPLGDIWNEYLSRQGVVTDKDFYAEIKKYEDEVLVKRA